MPLTPHEYYWSSEQTKCEQLQNLTSPYWCKTVPVKDVCLMSRYAADTWQLIGCEGDEVTVLTNKGVAGLLLKIALLVCLCCKGNERRVQWAAHHVQHLILTLTAHQLTYIPLITHSSLMTVYTEAPHMENNNKHIAEEKHCNYIFSDSDEDSQEGAFALFN